MVLNLEFFDIFMYMANGPPVPDFIQTRSTQEFKAPNKFTPFSSEMLKNAQTTLTRSPESGAVTMTEPPKYEDPTTSMSQRDKELTDQLLAQVMDSKGSKNPQEAVSQIEKKIPQEKKSQGFWAQLITAIQDFFRNIFR